ncbi:MAG: hypothetical protein ACJAZO_002685 [Myxococcota bacterium]|jgi:hypothetical protein
MRYFSVIIAAVAASTVTAILSMPLTFYIVAAGGQTMDPTTPGDQWIFLGGMAALVAGPLSATVAFLVVGGLGLRLATSQATDSERLTE